MSAQPLDVPRPVILAHGSLRHADFRGGAEASLKRAARPAAHIAALGEFLRVVRA